MKRFLTDLWNEVSAPFKHSRKKESFCMIPYTVIGIATGGPALGFMIACAVGTLLSTPALIGNHMDAWVHSMIFLWTRLFPLAMLFALLHFSFRVWMRRIGYDWMVGRYYERGDV